MKFCPDNCFFLRPTQEEQEKSKRFDIIHRCIKYHVTLYHLLPYKNRKIIKHNKCKFRG